MNISYITKHEFLDITNWSGTEYFIAKSIENEGANLDVICGLQKTNNLSLRIKAKIYGKPPHNLYFKVKSLDYAKNYAKQIDKRINANADIIFTSAYDTYSYLKSNKPKVFYNDSTFATLYNYYNWYENICKKTFQESMKIERLALNNSQLAIYSSDWAAKSAIEDFKMNPDIVKVVPFGANVSTLLPISEIHRLIDQKENNTTCQLVFIGVEWYRKGGDIVLEAVKYLNETLKLPTTLHLIGIDTIPDVEELPNYVINHGRISKTTKEGMLKIEKLISESHFLFVPSRAEAYGIVFCEAMAFGVPSITTSTGGIPTIIKNRENGFILDKDSSPQEYANTIYEAFTNKEFYKNVSLAAHQDYHDRLNWNIAGKTVMQYLKELV